MHHLIAKRKPRQSATILSFISRSVTLFDEHEIAEAVEIQQRSYRLLKYVSDPLILPSVVDFCSKIRKDLDDVQAARTWIAATYSRLPDDCKPDEPFGPPFERFVNFFSTYLLTSFTLRGTISVRGSMAPGHGCLFAIYLGADPNSRTRRLKRSHKRQAARMMADYVRNNCSRNRDHVMARKERTS